MKVTFCVIFLALLVACEQSPEQKAKSRAQAAISLCWEEQAKKSNDPGTARFIAGACEMMEAKFREQYSRSY